MPKSRGSAKYSTHSSSVPSSKGPYTRSPPRGSAQHQKQGTGLLGQMAATAGGVAAGSVIGHGISKALYGSTSNEKTGEAQPQNIQEPPNPCEVQILQLIDCVLMSRDLMACQGLQDAFIRCKEKNKLM